jgi:arylsulfatase
MPSTQIALAIVALASLALSASAEPARPNVVVMLSDNLGYGELGSYGGGAIRGAPTPRLDRLAEEGLRFTNFNVEVECTPSRSALLTGRMPLRSGTWRAQAAGLPGGLPPWEVTIAESLSQAGYATAIFGKWHLGSSEGRFPTDQGFDEWWGFPFSTNVATFADQVGWDPDAQPVPHLLEGRRGEPVREVEPYTTQNRPLIDERIASKAFTYIGEHAEDEQPFFLFVSWSLVHHPYLPHPDFTGASGNGPFADSMVEHDARVGQVLDAIRDAGIEQDTLVLYLSDNGPDDAHYPQVSNSGPYRGYLGSAYEGSIRTPFIARWPGRIAPGGETNEIVAMVDLFPTLANIAGAEVPGDRAIDGVDQGPLLLGESETSAREGLLIFSSRTLLAVKWRRFKVFLTGDDPGHDHRSWKRLWAPVIYNVEQDPREEVDIRGENMWVLAPAMRLVYPVLFSVDDEGLIMPGGEEPVPADLEIPFQSQQEIDASMDAIRWQFIKKRVSDILPFDD